LAFIAALNSVIGLYYYMKLAKEMVFSKSETTGDVPGFTDGVRVSIVALSVPVVLYGIFFGGLMTAAGNAVIFLK
jgi:NADH:ubiquinone oxidoreductase subunit 2 (subunit N)